LHWQASTPSAPTRHTLYQSETLHAVLLDFGTRDCVFVSFALRNASSIQPFGEHFFRKHRLNVILVTCTGSHWYQYSDSPALGAALARACRGFARSVTYGTSMGAYAALAFSGLIEADLVLAFSPQFSMNPAKLPQEQRWRDEIAEIQHRGGFVFDDMHLTSHGRIIVIFDPFDDDMHHIRALRAHHPRLCELPLPFTGHRSLTALQETGLLTGFLRDAAMGALNLAATRLAFRRQRRSSATYLRYAFRAVEARSPRSGAPLLRQADAATKPHEFENFYSNYRLSLRCQDQTLSAELQLRLLNRAAYLDTPASLNEFKRCLRGFATGDLATQAASALTPHTADDTARAITARLMLMHLEAAHGTSDGIFNSMMLLAASGTFPAYALEATEALITQQRTALALAFAHRALKTNPQDSPLLQFLASKLEDTGRHGEAISLYEWADAQGHLPPTPQRLHFARLLQKTGQPRAALAQAKQIAQAQPDHQGVLTLIAECHAQLGPDARQAQTA
jgi:tetratricopeptide (TPR) repeat protein